MNKPFKEQSGYYAVLTTFIGLCLSAIIYLAAAVFFSAESLKDVNAAAVSFITGVLFIFAFGGTFTFEKLSSKGDKKLRWFFNQPFIWQLVLFLIVAVSVLVVLTFVRHIFNLPIFGALDIGLNLVYSGFGFYVMVTFCRMLFYNEDK